MSPKSTPEFFIFTIYLSKANVAISTCSHSNKTFIPFVINTCRHKCVVKNKKRISCDPNLRNSFGGSVITGQFEATPGTWAEDRPEVSLRDRVKADSKE